IKFYFRHKINLSMNKKLFSLSLIFACAFITSIAHAQQGEWTWMKGSNGVNNPGTYGTQGVPDAANSPQAVFKAGEWTDKDGNFWLFGGSNVNYSGMNAMWKFDPS